MFVHWSSVARSEYIICRHFLEEKKYSGIILSGIYSRIFFFNRNFKAVLLYNSAPTELYKYKMIFILIVLPRTVDRNGPLSYIQQMNGAAYVV